MQKICQKLKIIKAIIQTKDDVLLLVKEHAKYFRYCTKTTMEIQKIIDTVDGDDLSELERLIDIYLEKHDKSDMIYHYCSMKTFKAILGSKSLWLSDSRFMNDKYEGRWIDKIVDEAIEELKYKYTKEQLSEYKKKYDALKNKKAYMYCFSKEADKLSQWRAYADDASGVAIGFSRKAIGLAHDFNFELALMDVLYEKEEHIRLVKESIQCTINNHYDIKQDKELAYYYKNPSFHEEEEVRILYTPENDMKQHTFDDPLASEYYRLMSKNISEIMHRNEGEKTIPYFEYDLTGTIKGFSSELIPEIVVAPKNRTNLTEIQELLKREGLDSTKVRRSESSYI